MSDEITHFFKFILPNGKDIILELDLTLDINDVKKLIKGEGDITEDFALFLYGEQISNGALKEILHPDLLKDISKEISIRILYINSLKSPEKIRKKRLLKVNNKFTSLVLQTKVKNENDGGIEKENKSLNSLETEENENYNTEKKLKKDQVAKIYPNIVFNENQEKPQDPFNLFSKQAKEK